MSYPAVYDRVRRLRVRTGVEFDPHWFRHTYATRILRCEAPVEVVTKLLGHAGVTTTLEVYGHLSVEDARRVLEEAGWVTDSGVRRGLRSVARFSAFCAAAVNRTADIDRTVVERYLADLRAELAARQRHNDNIGQVQSFLNAIRQHGWDDSLPAGALVFADDYPKRSERSPRALGERVAANATVGGI